MKETLLIAIALLVLLVLILTAKICAMRRAAREIGEGMHERLAADTNTLIDISSRDRCMRALATQINAQLRLLRRERRRCQQGDLELKEAITNISHDLRTPLTAISGYLDLLEREEKSANVQRYLDQIQNRTQALKDLTGELFRYSLAASTQELQLERLDLARMLQESLLAFYGSMQEKKIVPEITLPEEAIWRELDAGAVSRIFSNVIANALKYSAGDLHVCMAQDGTICFSNAAPGLDALTVGRLFDRFYTVSANHNSTGLGLSIARLLTERMGGRIDAEYCEGNLKICIAF